MQYGADVTLTDGQWLQASLPMRLGGLGVRSVSLLAPSAFLASAAGTTALQDMILSSISSVTDLEVIRTQDFWSSLCNVDSPTGILARCQKSWDNRALQTVHSALLANSMGTQDKARLLAISPLTAATVSRLSSCADCT